jgi:hypothetical protein
MKLEVKLITHDDNESSSSVDINQRGAAPFPFFTLTKEGISSANETSFWNNSSWDQWILQKIKFFTLGAATGSSLILKSESRNFAGVLKLKHSGNILEHKQYDSCHKIEGRDNK